MMSDERRADNYQRLSAVSGRLQISAESKEARRGRDSSCKRAWAEESCRNWRRLLHKQRPAICFAHSSPPAFSFSRRCQTPTGSPRP